MKNGFKVIDAHSHIYPEKIAVKASAATDTFYGTVAAHSGTAAELKRCRENGGIDISVVCSVATTQHQVHSANEYIASEVVADPEHLSGLGTMYPASDNLEGDFGHLVSLGLKGVKLHPDIQKFAVDDPRCLKIYEMCGEAKIPVLLHTGDKRYDFSNPNRVVKILKMFPHVQFVGGHFGGWSIWDKAVDAYVSFDNFAVDCSSSFPYITNSEALEIIRKYGTSRVLFGSDYPMWDPGKELERFFTLGLSDEDCMKILSGNAERIYFG